MKKKYQGSTKVKRAQLQALRRDFETLHMKPEDSVDEYFSKAMAIASKMRLHGDKMDDVTIIEKILRSMSPKFNYVVCAIEEANDIETMSIDELHSSLLVHEQKFKSQNTSTEEKALKSSTSNESSSWRGSGRGRGRGQGRGRGRGNFDSRGRGRGRGQYRQQSHHESKHDKSQIECYRCGRYGHYRSECYPNMSKEKGEASNFTQ